MRRYRNAVVFVFLMFTICILGCFRLLNDADVSVDIVLFNDIAKSAEENFDHLEELDTMNFSCDFLIFGTDGRILYQTGKTDLESLQEAIAKNYPHKSIDRNGVLLGEVVLLDGIEKQIDQMTHKA